MDKATVAAAAESVGFARALAEGERERAMSLLLEEHSDAVFRYCRRMLGNELDGEDVAQTVFLQAFDGLATLTRVGSVKAWLLTVARHRCLDRLKSVRRKRSLVSDEPLDEARAQVEPKQVFDPRVARALDECLDELDVQSRAVLVMRFEDELAYEEIGRLTDSTPGALRVRVARALPLLRRCLERKGVEP